MYKVLFIFFITIIHIPISAERKMIIVVHPFVNSSDSQFSWLSSGITDTVTNDLKLLDKFVVISQDDRRRALNEILFKQQIGSNEAFSSNDLGQIVGADLVFSGSYTVVNDKIRIIAKLTSIKDSSIERSIKLDGYLKDIFQIQDNITLGLVRESQTIKLPFVADIKLSEIDNEKILNKPKPQLSAYEYYSKGLESINSDHILAIDFFKKSIEIWPKYIKAILELSFIYSDYLNDYDKALQYLIYAERILREDERTSFEDSIDVINSIGLIYLNKEEIKKSKIYFDSAFFLTKGINQNNLSIVSLYNNIGLYYYRVGDYDNSYAYFRTSELILEKFNLKNTILESVIHNNIALIYSVQGLNERALKRYSKSLEILEKNKINNTTGYITLINNIATSLMNIGKYDESLEYLLYICNILENKNLQNTKYYINSTLITSTNFIRLELFDNALEINKVSEGVIYKNGLENSILDSYVKHNLAVILYKKKLINDALSNFLKSKSIKDNLKSQKNLEYSEVLSYIGLIYLEKNDLDEAYSYFRNSQEVLQDLKLENTEAYATILANIGLIYLRRSTFEKGIYYFENANRQFEKIGRQNTKNNLDVVDNLSEMYTILNNKKKVIEYDKKSLAIRDALNINEDTKYADIVLSIGTNSYELQDMKSAKYYLIKARNLFKKLNNQDTHNLVNALIKKIDSKKK
jgi:tetratricopeptide (TPR) repeat protein